MVRLNLSADEVLTTTRAVRKRLDLTRPVEREVIADCLRIALQAPTGSNRQDWQFVVVTDGARRDALAAIYRRAFDRYRRSGTAAQGRVLDSATYLAEHLHEVPVHLVPCLSGRWDGADIHVHAGRFGSILPAVWSFMLAARERGLGSAWTTLHLAYEREAADVLGIPYDRVTQCALIPVAYAVGTDFSPAPRAALEGVVHWDGW
jgi:nitroreductase